MVKITSMTIECDENIGSLNMLTKNVDGETCLDVECGKNVAVLYVSKLFGGSKTVCILHDGQWLTPNEFQNVSGRRSAKDWKRSIRHNGVSLKTFILCGLLEMKDGGSSPSHSGKEEKTGPKARGKGHRKKLKRKLKRKQTGGQAVKSERVKLTGDNVTIPESDIPTTVTMEESIDNHEEKTNDADDALRYVDAGSEVHGEQTLYENVTNKGGEITFDSNERKGDTTDQCKRFSDVQAQDHEEVRLPDVKPVMTKTVLEHRITESNNDLIHPYEVTVTPPPTPPGDEIDKGTSGIQVQSTAEINDVTGPIFDRKVTNDFKPFGEQSNKSGVNLQCDPIPSQTVHEIDIIKNDRQGVRSAQDSVIETSKGDNLMKNKLADPTVISPAWSRKTFESFHLDQGIPKKRNDVPALFQNDTVHMKDNHSTRPPAVHDNLDKTECARYPRCIPAIHPMVPYTHQHTQYSNSELHHPTVITYTGCKCNKDITPKECKHSYDISAKTSRVSSAHKRHYSELDQEKPLDLSMKKRKAEDQVYRHVTEAKSRDKDHVMRNDTCIDRFKHLSGGTHQQGNLFTVPNPVVKPRNTHVSSYPFINPLTKMTFDHSNGMSVPCFCSMCVNPLSLPVYVPLAWNWKHAPQYKV